MPEWAPSAIIMDDSKAEIAATKHAFGGSVRIFLCHWHVQKAWKQQLYLKVGLCFGVQALQS